MSADHVLTDAERSAGILTPEVMWKIKRVGSAALSPDGRTVLYTVTTYDMKENKGVTNIRSAPGIRGPNGSGSPIPAATSRRLSGAQTDVRSILFPTTEAATRFGVRLRTGTTVVR